MTWQFTAASPIREVAPAPRKRERSFVGVTVDVRHIPGIRHDHPKARGFWAGRTKVAPGFLAFLARGGRHRATRLPGDRSTWTTTSHAKGAWRVVKKGGVS